ncbi:hypothetical protein AA103193_2573 [Tanticharoenia sakaeratensis NBRC 103193]|nr:hypothetical protein AA103193_2573 [Tanticharoenia sakaeratensis NBRC 103193]
MTSVRDLELEGTKDVNLFRILADQSLLTVLVTADRAMARRRHEIEAIRDTGAIALICAKGWNQERDTLNRARMMMWWWPTILESAGKAKPGTFLALPWTKSEAALQRWLAR